MKMNTGATAKRKNVMRLAGVSNADSPYILSRVVT